MNKLKNTRKRKMRPVIIEELTPPPKRPKPILVGNKPPDVKSTWRTSGLKKPSIRHSEKKFIIIDDEDEHLGNTGRSEATIITTGSSDNDSLESINVLEAPSSQDVEALKKALLDCAFWKSRHDDLQRSKAHILKENLSLHQRNKQLEKQLASEKNLVLSFEAKNKRLRKENDNLQKKTQKKLKTIQNQFNELKKVEEQFKDWKKLSRATLSSLPAGEQSRVMQELKDILADKKACSICMNLDKDTVLIPCGHLTCGSCSVPLTKCPFCSLTIRRKQSIYSNT